jgi:hypothetical protein
MKRGLNKKMKAQRVQNETPAVSSVSERVSNFIGGVPYLKTAAIVAGAGLVGLGVVLAFRKFRAAAGATGETIAGTGSIGNEGYGLDEQGYDQQYTGAYPRSIGAVRAVTGGHPEDMNDMPAATDGTIYDGSELRSHDGARLRTARP